MNNMPEWRYAIVAIVLILALLTSDAAAVQKQGPVIAESRIEVQAIVRDIDLEKRTVTLAMPNSSLRTFVVDDRVKRFDKVQCGDVVKATYNQAKYVPLCKTKVKPNVTAAESLTRGPARSSLRVSALGRLLLWRQSNGLPLTITVSLSECLTALCGMLLSGILAT